MSEELKSIERPRGIPEVPLEKFETQATDKQLKGLGVFKPDFFQNKLRKALPNWPSISVIRERMEKIVAKAENFQVEAEHVEADSLDPRSRAVVSKLKNTEAILAKLDPFWKSAGF